MFREDRAMQNELPSNVFKHIYKRLGIKTNINDEKDLFSYLALNASNPKTIINLRQLNKLTDVLARQLYKEK